MVDTFITGDNIYTMLTPEESVAWIERARGFKAEKGGEIAASMAVLCETSCPHPYVCPVCAALTRQWQTRNRIPLDAFQTVPVHDLHEGGRSHVLLHHTRHDPSSSRHLPDHRVPARGAVAMYVIRRKRPLTPVNTALRGCIPWEAPAGLLDIPTRRFVQLDAPRPGVYDQCPSCRERGDK